MRVVVVTTWFPSAEAPGVAPFNVGHAHAIAREHDVSVVHARLGARGRPSEEEFAGLPVTRLPLDPARPHEFLRNLNVVRRSVADAEIVHSMAFSTLGVLAPLTPLIRSRWVHTEHWSGAAYPDTVPGLWPRLAFARHLLRLPRKVSAVSSVLATALARFTSDGRAEVVPCVVPDSFTPAAQPPWDPLTLVAVGGLVPGKRPLLAVDTVARLVADGVDTTLTWVGDGPLRAQIRAHAEELGVSDRIDLVGAVQPEKVVDHLHAHNVFFLPTAFETFLAAGAEAVASGRPVVLPGSGGFVDYVSEANGVLVDSDEPEALARGLLRARERFAGASPDELSATVTALCGADGVARRFDDLYRGVRG
ncbi:glycosyltransferase family 4 protein [Saccharomonospora iraqiensis]|uniref:glycosyltransferase family 4 protein n=1 Tax=Saccharomonospora iraqiensis TaxID=52698 RepID=UPI000478A591|nr:glycosyltransferase family 4 protein [Saccharomonospora iraqiensis]